MFYSEFILSKKGPLALLWTAAHWDKRLNKNQIMEIRIDESIDSILNPRVKLSLRTASLLTSGITRIYKRKALYFFNECSDCTIRVRSEMRLIDITVDPIKTIADPKLITLDEITDFVTFFHHIPDAHVNFDVRIQRFDNTIMDESMRIVELPNDEDVFGRDASRADFGSRIDSENPLEMFNVPLEDDGTEPFNETDLFSFSIFKGHPKPLPQPQPSPLIEGPSPPTEGPSPPPKGPSTPPIGPSAPPEDLFSLFEGPCSPPRLSRRLLRVPPIDYEMKPPSVVRPSEVPILFDDERVEYTDGIRDEREMEMSETERPDDEKSYTIIKMVKKKRRGIILDEETKIPGNIMREQIIDTSDTLMEFDLAPPNKLYLDIRGVTVEYLFNNPMRPLNNTLMGQFKNAAVIRHELQRSALRKRKVSRDDTIQRESISPLKPEFTVSAAPEPSVAKEPEPMISTRPEPIVEPVTESVVPMERETTVPSERGPEIEIREMSPPREPSPDKDIPEEPFVAQRRDYDSIQIPRKISVLDESLRITSGATHLEPVSSHLEPVSSHVTPDSDDLVRQRTNALLRHMSIEIENNGSIQFSKLVEGNRKRNVAQKFFSLLLLKKEGIIELNQEQKDPNHPNQEYNDIVITMGDRDTEADAGDFRDDSFDYLP